MLLLTGPCDSHSGLNVSRTNVVSNLAIDRSMHFFYIIDNEIEENRKSRQSHVIVDELRKFWRNESMGISELNEIAQQVDQQEGEFDIIFNGRGYEVSLPWRHEFSTECMPNNYDLCVKRLKSLQEKLKNDPDLLDEYNAIFKQQLQEGIVERVPERATNSQVMS